MLLSIGYSLSIKSVEIIFRPYYFVKLFGSINSRKSILQNHVFFGYCFFWLLFFFFVFFFVIEGDLLCCTKIKVTSLFPNKAINFSNNYNKPPDIKCIHHSVK